MQEFLFTVGALLRWRAAFCVHFSPRVNGACSEQALVWGFGFVLLSRQASWKTTGILAWHSPMFSELAGVSKLFPGTL
jgi:hypothetical protein